MANNIDSDLNVQGAISARSFDLPAGTVENVDISSTANLAGGKMQMSQSHRHSQNGTVAAATEYLSITRGATGTVVSLEAALNEQVPSGDKTVTIDLQVGNQSTAFATILSSTLVLDNTDSLREVNTATITTPALADGDVLKLTVAIAGSTGDDPQGLCVDVRIYEDAQ